MNRVRPKRNSFASHFVCPASSSASPYVPSQMVLCLPAGKAVIIHQDRPGLVGWASDQKVAPRFLVLTKTTGKRPRSQAFGSALRADSGVRRPSDSQGGGVNAGTYPVLT